jgi:hypothetical protein
MDGTDVIFVVKIGHQIFSTAVLIFVDGGNAPMGVMPAPES